jgi:histidyl-tRNA synthetase
VVILGDEEVARQVATLKALREDAGQRQLPLSELAAELAGVMAVRSSGQN